MIPPGHPPGRRRSVGHEDFGHGLPRHHLQGLPPGRADGHVDHSGPVRHGHGADRGLAEGLADDGDGGASAGGDAVAKGAARAAAVADQRVHIPAVRRTRVLRERCVVTCPPWWTRAPRRLPPTRHAPPMLACDANADCVAPPSPSFAEQASLLDCALPSTASTRTICRWANNKQHVLRCSFAQQQLLSAWSSYCTQRSAISPLRRARSASLPPPAAGRDRLCRRRQPLRLHHCRHLHWPRPLRERRRQRAPVRVGLLRASDGGYQRWDHAAAHLRNLGAPAASDTSRG